MESIARACSAIQPQIVDPPFIHGEAMEGLSMSLGAVIAATEILRLLLDRVNVCVLRHILVFYTPQAKYV